MYRGTIDKKLVHINGEFINLYTKENPILEPGDTTYALVFNVIDYHCPILVEGIVHSFKVVNGQDRIYNISLQRILDSPYMIDKLVINKSFEVYYISENNQLYRNHKQIQITADTDLTKFVFPVEAFFVRQTESQAIEVRNFYCDIIEKDLNDMLTDINNIKNTTANG